MRRKKTKDLNLAILYGVLWFAAGMLQFYLFPAISVPERLIVSALILPLLLLSARHFAGYWRGRPD